MLKHLLNAREILPGLFGCRSALELDDSVISLAAAPVSLRPERFVDDDIGPNLDSMSTEHLLMLLFQDSFGREHRSWKTIPQSGKQFALIAAFGLKEAWIRDRAKGIAKSGEKLISIHS